VNCEVSGMNLVNRNPKVLAVAVYEAGTHKLEDAIEVIHEHCGGIARKVNNVCVACLLDAFAQRKTLIDDRMVKVVLENEFAA